MSVDNSEPKHGFSTTHDTMHFVAEAYSSADYDSVQLVDAIEWLADSGGAYYPPERVVEMAGLIAEKTAVIDSAPVS